MITRREGGGNQEKGTRTLELLELKKRNRTLKYCLKY